MKKQSTRLLAPLSDEIIADLTTVVKEVLATGYKKNGNPVLSNSDLWNIQRRGKKRRQRRYI